MRSRINAHVVLLVLLALVVPVFGDDAAQAKDSSRAVKSDPVGDVEALQGRRNAPVSVKKAADLKSVEFGSGAGRTTVKLRWCTRRAASLSLQPGTSYAYRATVVFPGAPVMAGEVWVYRSPQGERHGSIGMQGVSHDVPTKVDGKCVTASVPVSAFPTHLQRVQFIMGTEVVNTSPKFRLLDHGPARWVFLR